MSNVQNKKNHHKVIFVVLLIVLAFTVTVLYFGIIKQTHQAHLKQNIKIDGVLLPEAKAMATFHLKDQLGHPFTNQNLTGQWSMLFFGFTNCGYVCPTTLTELNKMYKVLQQELPDRDLPQIVLVTVDPERDSVERMRDYVAAFNPHFKGIRGDLTETEQFENDLHISAVKMQAEGQPDDQYMINHSAEILLINPEGKIQAYLSYPHKAEQMIKDYKLILNSIG